MRCLLDAVNWKAVDEDAGPCIIELGLIDDNKPMSNENVCIRRSVTAKGKRQWAAKRALQKADLAYQKKYRKPENTVD